MEEKPATDGDYMYGHGMLVFLKPGQEHSVELLREEKERRIILHKKRIALLGEEETKKLELEDYEREQRLLDRVLQKKALDTPLSIPELPVDPKIKEMPATRGDYSVTFGMLVFPKPGQEHTMEVNKEERQRRLLLHKNRIALLGEEEAEKLQKEDYEREQQLLDALHSEGSAKRGKNEFKLELTSTQRLDYEKRLRESGGFDIGDISPYCNVPIKPYVLGHPLMVNMVERYAKLALGFHNKNNNTKYQFVKVLKANIGGYDPGWNYYITSQVKDMAGSGSPTLNFQAFVNSFEDQEPVTSIVPEKSEQKHRPRPDFVELTSTQLLDYKKRLRESGGFDVGDIPGYVLVPVRPFVLDCRESLEMIEGYAKFALDDYNKRNCTNYQLVKALKANIGSGCPGQTYYITFQVKDMAGSGSPTLNFQAKVEIFQGKQTTMFIAPEP